MRSIGIKDTGFTAFYVLAVHHENSHEIDAVSVRSLRRWSSDAVACIDAKLMRFNAPLFFFRAGLVALQSAPTCKEFLTKLAWRWWYPTRVQTNAPFRREVRCSPGTANALCGELVSDCRFQRWNCCDVDVGSDHRLWGICHVAYRPNQTTNCLPRLQSNPTIGWLLQNLVHKSHVLVIKNWRRWVQRN